jgi:glycosyltransferase involved in cell wall biosynthesis
LNKKLNILFLASWYPNKVQPSNGNFIQQHAQAVSTLCNVFALHIISRIQTEDFVIEQNQKEGVLETIVYYKKVTSKIPGLNLILKQKIRRKAHKIGYHKIIEKAKNIDLTHLNVCFPAGLFALHLKNKFKTPFIISENWTVLLDSDPTTFNPIEQFFVNIINRNADLLCPVSMDLQKALTKIAPSQNFKIIPNVVNTAKFEQDSFYQSSKTIKILHVSNLKDEHKNITGILNVIKRLSSKQVDFKITIAGNGDVNYFINKAKKLNIPDHFVSFESEKTREEVALLMNTHDLFLLFSNYENLPCVVVEALSVGLPVLATDVGGTAEMITDKNGIIIDAKNETQLEEQLILFIDNISNYDRVEIGKTARKIYSYETVGLQFLNIYKEILHN